MKISGVGSSTNVDSYSFYNSSSRINEAARAAQTEKAAGLKAESKTDAVKESTVKSSAIYQREDYVGPNETLVSADNKYQKQQLSGEDKKQAEATAGTAADTSSKTMERLAGKLVDRLPQILKDIMKIGTDGTVNNTETPAAEGRVIITEKDNKEYLEKQAENAQLQDISLAGISK